MPHNKLAAPRTSSANPRSKLSPREIEILQWVAAGLSSQDISDRLHIAYTTVETDVWNACRKLDATCRTQAVAEAIRAHIIL